MTNMYPTAEDPAFGAFVKAHVDALIDAGLKVEVFFIGGRQNAFSYALAIPRLKKLAQSGEFDLVHAHYGLAGFCAGFQRLPLVVTFWGDDLLGTPAKSGGITTKSRIARSLSNIAARRAHGVICVSSQMRSVLANQSDRRRARVIPGGVDSSRFSPGDRASARQRLGLPSDGKIILFPNTPTERRKRLDLATSAVALVNARIPDARLKVVTGVRPIDMPDYYRAADCLLLTSDWEGSPTVIKEGLCCDLPVVSVDAGDAWEWMRLAPGCELVERSAESISEGLFRVLASGKRIDGAAVRQRADWRLIVKSVLTVYDEAVAAARQAAH